MAQATEGTTKKDYFQVPFSKLRIVEGFNHRKDYGDIDSLKESIRSQGVQVPLIGYRDVQEGIYFIVAGHRRHAACKLLFEESKGKLDIMVPFMLEAKGTTEADRVLATILTNDGKALNPLELADCVKDLLAFGWTEAEIAPKIGKTPLYVSRLNLLNAAPKKFRKLIEQGKISATLAIKIAGEQQIDSFMAEYEDGKFNGGEGGEPKKITAKNLRKTDSWKFFKKFTTQTDIENVRDERKEFYEFMVKVQNNQVSTKEFSAFFTN